MQLNKKEGFSILLVTWGNLPHLKLLVESIKKNSELDHELLVHVQDPERDDSVGFLSGEGIPYTTSAVNIGISKGVNKIAKLATKDIICFMDDDMYVCPGWDTKLLEFLGRVRDDKYFLCSTTIQPNVSAQNGHTHIKGNYGTVYNFEEEKLLDEFDRHEFKSYYQIQSNPWIVPKSLWLEMGGADEEIFAPGFEEGVAKNAWDAGCRFFVSVPESRVYHFQSRSMARLSDVVRMRRDRNTHFIAKHKMTISQFHEECIKRGKIYEEN